MAETKINSKVEAVKRFFADSKAKNHPIKDHPVSEAEEYVRDLYLDMLCVMAQYECRDTENGFTFIRRIMSACENAQPLEEYIKRSMEITPARTAEFIKQCKDNGLCEIFMIDSMILACADGAPNAKQADFLAQFGDMLGFDKEKMQELARFARAILEQDSDGYQELLDDSNEQIQINILCYSKDFVSGLLISSSAKKHYYAPELVNVPFNKSLNFSNLDEVIIENLTFVNNTITAESVKNLTVRNCFFHDYERKSSYRGYSRINAICSSNVKNFTIERCAFENCICEGERTALIHNYSVFGLRLSECKFYNIKNPVGYSDSVTSSAVVYCSGDRHDKHYVTINKCEFNKCSVGGHECGTIMYRHNISTKLSISDSRFSDCHGSYMFADGYFTSVIDNNNQYSNCCTKYRR